MMRVLVTGAAGFIGSAVSRRLLERGDHIVGLDNFDPFYDRTIKERNLVPLRGFDGFEFCEGDLLDAETVARLLSDRARPVDRVVHLAALAGVRPSLMAPARYLRVNVEGTVRLLEACRVAGVRRLVVASSSSVYGSRSETPFSERDSCDRPSSPYAASKKATEVVCATYNELYDLGISCLRFFTVYGPGQRPEMAIHKFVRLALAGGAIPMFGDGTSGRDFTYIDDIVDGTVAALDRQNGSYKIYNLGGSQPVLLRDLIAAIGEATGCVPRIDHRPWQAGDVPITCADVTLARRELDYAPKVALAKGLRRFVDWYRATILPLATPIDGRSASLAG